MLLKKFNDFGGGFDDDEQNVIMAVATNKRLINRHSGTKRRRSIVAVLSYDLSGCSEPEDQRDFTSYVFP